jgi:hypothetical protein
MAGQALHRIHAAARLTAKPAPCFTQHSCSTKQVCLHGIDGLYASLQAVPPAPAAVQQLLHAATCFLQRILQCLPSRLLWCCSFLPAWWRIHRPHMVTSRKASQRQVSCPAVLQGLLVLIICCALGFRKAVTRVGPHVGNRVSAEAVTSMHQ